MKKITLAGLFGVLLVFTLNVNASSTLSWESTPSIYSFGSGTDTIYGFNGVYQTVKADLDVDTYAFSHDWEFSVAADPGPGAWVAGLAITLYDDYFFDTAQIFLDGESMGFGTFDQDTHIRVFEFSEYLDGTHVLSMAAQGVKAFATYGIALTTDVKLTPNPIPASIWLFGSAILGIGGLASRRKSLPAESLDV